MNRRIEYTFQIIWQGGGERHTLYVDCPSEQVARTESSEYIANNLYKGSFTILHVEMVGAKDFKEFIFEYVTGKEIEETVNYGTVLAKNILAALDKAIKIYPSIISISSVDGGA